MNSTRVILALLIVVATMMINVTAQTMNWKYCTMNTTTTEEIFNKFNTARNAWISRENKESVRELLSNCTLTAFYKVCCMVRALVTTNTKCFVFYS